MSGPKDRAYFYKGTFSIVLMANPDSDYSLVHVNVVIV